MSARAAAALLPMLAACAGAPDGPDRVTLSTPVAEHNEAGAGIGGLRLSFEEVTDPEWTVHMASQWIVARGAGFPLDDGGEWHEVGELVFGARRWWPVGPLHAGLGAEVGYGESTPRDEDYVLATALATLRWDLEFPGGSALSLEADLHYRAPLGFDAPALGDGTPARDVFGGWLLFVGLGYAW